jgi:hypothetical protein
MTLDPFLILEPDDTDDFVLADVEPPRKLYHCPFRIIACVNEGIPYRFTGLTTDKGDGELPILVDVVRKPLYSMGRRTIELKEKRFVKGLADYTIEGLEEEIQIERKSLEDLYGTLGGRRDDFEAEIARINLCKFAAVVIESGWDEILLNPPSHSRLNPKTVSRTIQSWSICYPNVHWFTLAGRQHAEIFTFRLLEMFWRQRQHGTTHDAT